MSRHIPSNVLNAPNPTLEVVYCINITAACQTSTVASFGHPVLSLGDENGIPYLHSGIARHCKRCRILIRCTTPERQWAYLPANRITSPSSS